MGWGMGMVGGARLGIPKPLQQRLASRVGELCGRLITPSRHKVPRTFRFWCVGRS